MLQKMKCRKHFFFFHLVFNFFRFFFNGEQKPFFMFNFFIKVYLVLIKLFIKYVFCFNFIKFYRNEEVFIVFKGIFSICFGALIKNIYLIVPMETALLIKPLE